MKNPRTLLFNITTFSVRIAFIRTENVVGARSAQWPLVDYYCA